MEGNTLSSIGVNRVILLRIAGQGAGVRSTSAGKSVANFSLAINPSATRRTEMPSEERSLREKLTIAGLSSPLKADKRAELAQMLADVTDVHVESELRIGREGRNGSKERKS